MLLLRNCQTNSSMFLLCCMCVVGSMVVYVYYLNDIQRLRTVVVYLHHHQIKSKGGLFCLAARMLDCTGETTISIMSIYLCKLALSYKHAENIYI